MGARRNSAVTEWATYRLNVKDVTKSKNETPEWHGCRKVEEEMKKTLHGCR